MVAPASYGWSLALVEAMPNMGTVDVPAHDINENVDEDSAELAVDGDVIANSECEIAFDIPNKRVTVTNLTGEEWEAQSNLYVSARRTPITGANVGGDTEALEARIATLEGQVTDLSGQVVDLSGQLDDHEGRISALETPAGTRKR